MPAVEWHLEWVDIIVSLGSLILIFLALFAVWKFVNPIAVKITRALDLMLGRGKTQGFPAMPSMIERFDEITVRLTSQDAAIDAIKLQVTPNHGSTTKLSEDVQTCMAALVKLKKQLNDHIGIPDDEAQP